MSLRDARDCTSQKWRDAWYGTRATKAMGKLRRGGHGGFHYGDCAQEQTAILEKFDAIEDDLRSMRVDPELRDLAASLGFYRKGTKEEKIKEILRHAWKRRSVWRD